MNGLFTRKKTKALLSSKSMEIPDSAQSDYCEQKHWRYRPHLKRFRRNSGKIKQNKYPHVKSLPNSFSQSSEQRSPTALPGHLLVLKKSGSGLLPQSLKYSTDEEDSSITSGSGRLQMTAGKSNGVTTTRTKLMVTDYTGNYSGSSGNHPLERLNSRTRLASPGPIGTGARSPTSTTNHILDANTLIASHNFVTEDELQQLIQENECRKQEHLHLQEQLEQTRNQYQSDLLLIQQNLQDERERCERLEDQINDLTELHQNEIENLKQLISDMEEKVQYQSEDRLRDINEALEICHTRISKMEHQHNQQLQQLITLDSLENSSARQLLPKFINVLLTVLQVILILVATMASVIIPFFRTRLRVINTLFCVFILFVIYNRRNQILHLLKYHVDHPLWHAISFTD